MATCRPILANRRIGISSLKILLSIFSSFPATKIVSPKTNRILAILEPTTLPKTMDDSPASTAVIEVANSGSEVPNATMVIPITKDDIPRDSPIFSAESIK